MLHTPEPWHSVHHNSPQRYHIDHGPLNYHVAQVPGMGAQVAANAARIVACVNALAGIADPEAAIKAAREALTACDGIVSAFGDPERIVKATIRRAISLLKGEK